ncbi:MAG: hypothetical protein FK734_11380 [Asgard group archaeon]|nr:hypothetical protein [Asgard group archaeon]
MRKMEAKANNLSSIKHFRILVVGSKESGKNILIERLIQNEKYIISYKKNSDVQFGLFEKLNEKFIVEFYENFHYQLNAKDRIKFLERCNLAIIVSNISESEIGESINIIEDFEFDLGKLFPSFIPFKTIIVGTKVNPHDPLSDDFRNESCFKNSHFLDLSGDENEINNELMLLKEYIFTTQITNPLDYHLIKKITTGLVSDDILEQRLAIHLVGKYHLKQYSDMIIKLAFSNESIDVQCASIWALGQLGLTNYTNKLIELFQTNNTNDNEMKSEIMIALLKMLDSTKKELIEKIKATSSILSRVNQLPFEILVSEREKIGL